MGRFRKKPVEIEAVQFVETRRIPCERGTAVVHNDMEIANFMDRALRVRTLPEEGRPEGRTVIEIDTLEGVMQADVGDWIIKGIQGEFYPCKPGVFEATYEPVEE